MHIRKDVIDAIGNTPLILRKPGLDAPSVGDIVRISVVGKAHVFS